MKQTNQQESARAGQADACPAPAGNDRFASLCRRACGRISRTVGTPARRDPPTRRTLLDSEKGLDKKATTRFLTAVGDPMRLQIIFLLGREVCSNVGTIVPEMGRLSHLAVSHDPKVHKEAGVLDGERNGQAVHYWLARDEGATRLRELAEVVQRCPASAEGAA